MRCISRTLLLFSVRVSSFHIPHPKPEVLIPESLLQSNTYESAKMSSLWGSACGCYFHVASENWHDSSIKRYLPLVDSEVHSVSPSGIRVQEQIANNH